MTPTQNSPKLIEFNHGRSKNVAKAPERRFKFTDPAIHALKPTDRHTYYFDTLVRGFVLGVSPQGKKSFLLYRRINRRPERVPIGRFPDMRAAIAREEAEKMNAAIARKENPAAEVRAIRDEVTFDELFTRYLAARREKGKKCRDHEWLYKKYLHGWKLRQISTITDDDCEAMHASVGQNHGKHAANRALELVSAVYNFAKKKKWKGENPALTVEPYGEQSRERFLKPEELPRFYEALMAEPNETIRDFILIALLTGARRGNVQEMRWAEIDWTERTWRIPETKNGRPLTIPLTAKAVEILKVRKKSAAENDEFVFPGSGKSRHLTEPKGAWKRILDRANIADLRLHDLRRTAGSWMAGTGASLLTIGKGLGHKSSRATEVYARLDLSTVRAAMDKSQKAMMAAARK